MVLRLPTSNKKITLLFELETPHITNIIFAGYDEEFPNTDFFYRRIPIEGKRRIEIPMPLTPRNLTVDIFSEGGDLPFKITKFNFKGLRWKSRWSPSVSEFIDFAQDFSLKAGYADTGVYYSKNKRYVIEYIPSIKNDSGHSYTPARIEKKAKYIQAGKDYMIKLTVPERQVILFHEYAHGFINKRPDSEHEADKNGNRIYLALGNPQTEIMYAYDQVLSETDKNLSRAVSVYKNIIGYV